MLISVSDTGWDCIGQAIGRCIAESHGGRLWATSNDGRGATFHFTLPPAVVEVSATI
jgi:signal transduction histidine kinase